MAKSGRYFFVRKELVRFTKSRAVFLSLARFLSGVRPLQKTVVYDGLWLR